MYGIKLNIQQHQKAIDNYNKTERDDYRMKLGVIGGLGPIATAYFLELVIKMTDAICDQEHLEMIIYNCPSIPDRTDYILGKCKADPIVPMIHIGQF